VKKLFTIVIIFLISFSNYSQWSVLNPYPSPNTPYIGSAPSPNKYVTVTPQGEAILTTDGGTTWHVKQLPLDGIYRSTYFLSENLGWVAGAVGSGQVRIFKTTDGGFNWIHQPNAPDTTKYDVFFINENVGWIVGFNGMIIKTTNGGDDWFSQTNTAVSNKTLYGVHASDINNVYVVGNADAVLKSTDGGTSFTLSPMIFSNATDYRGVYFPPTGSGLLGFITGNRGRVAKTTDGGNTWASVHNPGNTNQMWAIDFSDDNSVGLACGASSYLVRSTDGGNTWTQISLNAPSMVLYSVRFASNNVAYLSGGSGYYFKSTDAGLTWEQLGYRFTTTSIKDVGFANNEVGYVVGTNFVAKTENGGVRWTVQTSPFSGDINEVVAPSPNVAIAGCDGGNVIRTTNGGTNWELIATGITGTNSDILAIDFVNDNLGMAVGYNGSVARTTDGGATWNIISTISGGNPWDMDMLDSTHAWVAATGERIFATTDGGFTWTQQLAVGGLGTYGISFANKDVGVAGGTSGNTYYTTNGGATWSPAVTPPGNTVWGIHIAESPVYGTVAMTACASGYVYKSTDGGRNWELEPRFSISTMSDVWMTDAANAWFVGNSGLILKYYEPGNIPVELLSFNASVIDDGVNLIWTTATETNNFGFEVERKVASSDWGKVGFVNGKGTTTNISSYSFRDESIVPGKYFYRLKQIDYDGSYSYSKEIEVDLSKLPVEFALSQNYPNPFNPATIINYQLAENSFVTLKIYDVLGNEVVTLVNEPQPAGVFTVQFDGSTLASGMYIYKLMTENFTTSKKMMLLK